MSKRAKGHEKVEKVMHEFKEGTLHSGKGGPKVTSRKHAQAIAMSEAGMHRSRMGKGGRGK